MKKPNELRKLIRRMTRGKNRNRWRSVSPSKMKAVPPYQREAQQKVIDDFRKLTSQRAAGAVGKEDFQAKLDALQSKGTSLGVEILEMKS